MQTNLKGLKYAYYHQRSVNKMTAKKSAPPKNDLKKLKKIKDESLDRLRNQLEQAKLNISEASKNGDLVQLKYWAKQKTMIDAVLQKVQEILPKK